MKVLLDEMFEHAIADTLRERGHDVVSIQRDRPGLRHTTDPAVFAAAQDEQRAVVTENAVDFLAVVSTYARDAVPHWGLVLTTNSRFPRHQPDQAVRLLVAALDAFLVARADSTEPTSETHWLQPT
ncbi:MAG: DUF5615 family PIN-like protein [Acidimicrobiia bacterium]|nr:DUF5615 family PIN-like protein [Acidimicrobiia bacterium]